MARLFLSAAHKSSGKTTVSIGLAAALRRRQIDVRPFKKGPDYIDPMWLTLASGRPCYNLDFNTQTRAEILRLLAAKAAGGGFTLIEGNKGLHDGVDLEGRDCSAALAKLTKSPVVLIVDAFGMARGVAPLVRGYADFDRKVEIAGVILNRIGGARQAGKLRQAIERYTDLAVLGEIPRDEALALSERHLGLTTPTETWAADAIVAAASDAVANGVDIDRLLAIAARAPALDAPPAHPEPTRAPDVRIAIARDAAFGFYYPDDLEALRRGGAELIEFDTLSDAHLPHCDGLFIGGGFPETFGERLAANVTLREEIRAAIAQGLPTYAECGGLMYLSRALLWQGERYEMVGAIAADARMHERPQGRGLVELAASDAFPWRAPHTSLKAHEFHHAALENIDPDVSFAWRVERGHGVDGRNDGLVVGSVLASFSHLRDTARFPWTRRFLEYVRRGRSPAPSTAPLRAALPEPKMGEVYIVGAGPGDPDLLTLRALRLMRRADVVLYDRLAHSPIMDLLSAGIERISVGKRPNNHEMSQDEICALMERLARQGRRVLRLKGGDPFMFGRGGEEIEYLAERGIPFEVCPGITAAMGAAAYAGIPLTHREHAQACVFVTGHGKDGHVDLDWNSLIQPHQTVAIYMGLRNLTTLTQEFIVRGAKPDTPAAIVDNATRANQRVLVGTLETLAGQAHAAELKGPSIVIVGSVVTLRAKLIGATLARSLPIEADAPQMRAAPLEA